MKQGMIQRERFVKQGRGGKQIFTRNMASQKGVFHGTTVGGKTGWLHWGGGGGVEPFIVRNVAPLLIELAEYGTSLQERTPRCTVLL